MPVFEIYNADGSLQLDLTNRITRILTFQRITAAGSFYSDGFFRGTMFFAFTLEAATNTFTGYPTITQSMDRGTVSWTAPPVPMYLLLGTY